MATNIFSSGYTTISNQTSVTVVSKRTPLWDDVHLLFLTLTLHFCNDITSRRFHWLLMAYVSTDVHIDCGRVEHIEKTGERISGADLNTVIKRLYHVTE
jgi:hypothetical protein